MSALDHPQIAKVIDTFVEEERSYLVLDHVPGENLRQTVRVRGPQLESVVLRWAKDMANMLAYLHSQEPAIVHRDFTPDNLLMKDDGTLVLIDFGAANQFVGTATGTLVGKQSYMPPEQVRGKITRQSDIYAMGCTLHFLLTGEDPEPLSTSYPKSISTHISSALNQLVADMTRLELSERLESAVVLRDRIESLLEKPKLKLAAEKMSDPQVDEAAEGTIIALPSGKLKVSEKQA